MFPRRETKIKPNTTDTIVRRDDGTANEREISMCDVPDRVVMHGKSNAVLSSDKGGRKPTTNRHWNICRCFRGEGRGEGKESSCRVGETDVKSERLSLAALFESAGTENSIALRPRHSGDRESRAR